MCISTEVEAGNSLISHFTAERQAYGAIAQPLRTESLEILFSVTLLRVTRCPSWFSLDPPIFLAEMVNGMHITKIDLQRSVLY